MSKINREEYESEETEVKKDKTWAMNQVNNLDGVRIKGEFADFTTIPKDKAIRIISDIDEPDTLSQEWINNNSVYASSDGVTEEYVHVDDLQNLLVPKQEELEAKIQELIETYKQEEDAYSNPENGWISGFIEDLKSLLEEEQKYYALIKGHENIGSDDKYWNYCLTDESLDIGDNKVHADVLAEYVLNATKDEWTNLGINEDNAHFVKVEELEE